MDADREIQIADYFETQTITKDSGSYYKLRDWIRQEIQSAILAEREACAKICDAYEVYCKSAFPVIHKPMEFGIAVSAGLAHNIRARSNAPETEKEITVKMPPKSRHAGFFTINNYQTLAPGKNFAPDPVSA